MWGEEAASFTGFTAATYLGNQGGREQMHAHCDAEYPGSHFCHVSEYYLTNNTTAVPGSGAWIDQSAGVAGYSYSTSYGMAHPLMGRYTAGSYSINCNNWTATGSGTTEGLTVRSSGPDLSTTCNVARRLACCDSTFRESYVGYTTAAVNGNMGGRGSVHVLCATEYPGSHMCHIAEYHRAHPIVSPPSAGIWLDQSAVLEMDSTTIALTYGIASSEAGRYTGGSYSHNCNNWTATGSTSEGLTIRPGGPDLSTACNVARRVACCM